MIADNKLALNAGWDEDLLALAWELIAINLSEDANDRYLSARDLKGDPFDAHAVRQAVAPWGERLTDRRFETEGEWRKRLAGGTRGTVDLLARELKDALRRA